MLRDGAAGLPVLAIPGLQQCVVPVGGLRRESVRCVQKAKVVYRVGVAAGISAKLWGPVSPAIGGLEDRAGGSGHPAELWCHEEDARQLEILAVAHRLPDALEGGHPRAGWPAAGTG